MFGLARGTAILVLLTAVTAAAQGSNQTQLDRYQGQYGVPINVTLLDLVSNPAIYEDMSVKVRGVLEGSPPRRGSYALWDPLGSRVPAVPVPEAEAQFTDDAPSWIGAEIEVTGVFERSQTIKFWRYLDPTDFKKAASRGELVSLEALRSRAGKLDGKMVRVVGEFRGRNLFGDLPDRSEREPSDWVLKDEASAVWVTGKEPKGEGWHLDLGTKRDTNRWIEVVGRPETVGNVTYIRALSVVLCAPPPRAAPEAAATASAALSPHAKVPPVVVFSIPPDGEREIPSAGVFEVQFSKDMNEESFRGRVLFGYAGPRRAGDRDFVGLKATYDRGRRTLVVDPGDVLRPGRAVELRLLPGILDEDGLDLTPRPGHEADAVKVDVLQFEVAPSQALLPGS